MTLDFADALGQYSPQLAKQIRDQQIKVNYTKDKLTFKKEKSLSKKENTTNEQNNKPSA